jgi:hypothetical protein
MHNQYFIETFDILPCLRGSDFCNLCQIFSRITWMRVMTFIFSGRHFTLLVTYKGQIVPVHTMKTRSGVRGIATLILNLSTRWKMSGQLHAVATVSLGKSQVLGEEESV